MTAHVAEFGRDLEPAVEGEIRPGFWRLFRLSQEIAAHLRRGVPPPRELLDELRGQTPPAAPSEHRKAA